MAQQAYSSICPNLDLVDGSTADVTLPIAAMTVGDVIKSISHITSKSAIATETPVDVTSATIVDGGFTLDFATAGDQLRVFWFDTSA